MGFAIWQSSLYHYRHFKEESIEFCQGGRYYRTFPVTTRVCSILVKWSPSEIGTIVTFAMAVQDIYVLL